MKNYIVLISLFLFSFSNIENDPIYELSTEDEPFFYSAYDAPHSFVVRPFASQLPSIYKGFGTNWQWPTTYEVRIVTTLNDTGAGSLRSALTSATGAEGIIVVFNGLSGRIQTQSEIAVGLNKFFYIAGQTSENGIIVSVNNPSGDFGALAFYGVQGTITQDMTFAAGETTVLNGCCSDSFNIRGGLNHIIDRCNLIWGSDETFSIANATNITVQRSIIAEPLVTPTGWTNSRGYSNLVTQNTNRVTFYGNLWSHHQQRAPLINGITINTNESSFEYVKNVSYNWGAFNFVAGTGTDMRINLINNVTLLKAGVTKTRYSYAIDGNTGHLVYARGNYNNFRTLATDPEFQAIGCHSGCAVYMSNPLPVVNQVTTPFSHPLSGESILTRQQVLDFVIPNAGDPNFVGGLTTRMRNDAINLTGDFVDSPNDVGGYPTIAAGTIITDSDNDGIPDSEEGTWGNDTFGYLSSLVDATPIPPTPEPTQTKSSLFGW
jgi:hypothetical protein